MVIFFFDFILILSIPFNFSQHLYNSFIFFLSKSVYLRNKRILNGYRMYIFLSQKQMFCYIIKMSCPTNEPDND